MAPRAGSSGREVGAHSLARPTDASATADDNFDAAATELSPRRSDSFDLPPSAPRKSSSWVAEAVLAAAQRAGTTPPPPIAGNVVPPPPVSSDIPFAFAGATVNTTAAETIPPRYRFRAADTVYRCRTQHCGGAGHRPVRPAVRRRRQAGRARADGPARDRDQQARRGPHSSRAEAGRCCCRPQRRPRGGNNCDRAGSTGRRTCRIASAARGRAAPRAHGFPGGNRSIKGDGRAVGHGSAGRRQLPRVPRSSGPLPDQHPRRLPGRGAPPPPPRSPLDLLHWETADSSSLARLQQRSRGRSGRKAPRKTRLSAAIAMATRSTARRP